VDRLPVSGFHVYYKPYESAGDYFRQTVVGTGVRRIILAELAEDTVYGFRMQSYNTDGLSKYSNTAVKKTLGESMAINIQIKV